MNDQHYIQYHNADGLGRYPNKDSDFATSFDSLHLDGSIKYDSWFWTKKKTVEKAIGQYCFLIVGKTEQKIKKYVLWAYFKIEDFQINENGFYNVYGTGYDFAKPILLNDLENFSNFKDFCGNFGIGFQNIDKNPFCKTLISLLPEQNLDSLKTIEKKIEENDLENSSANIIEQWLNRKPSYRQYQKDIIDLFQVAFENTMIPESSWFGYPPTLTSISIMFGRIFLVAIFDNRIEILVDTDISKEIGFETRIVGTSKPSGLNLYWVSTDIGNIRQLIENKIIWQHYKIASLKINNAISMRSERKEWLEEKFLVKNVFNGQYKEIDEQTIEQTFDREMKLSLKDSRAKRQERLKQAIQKPISTVVQTKIFIRNADVVVEVLERAKGSCEKCKTTAPFNRDTDNTAYLEVHHIIPLADNGDDIIENAIALCPNCHRQAHYGKKTY